MGRPINKKFFGNTNPSYYNDIAHGNTGVGGEGITSVDFTSNRGNFVSAPTITMPAPSIADGVTAVLSPIYIHVGTVATGAGKAGLQVGDVYTYAGTGNAQWVVASTTSTNATFTVTNNGSGILLNAIPGGTTQGALATRVSGTGTTSTFLLDIYWRISNGIGGVVATTEKGSGYLKTESLTITGTGAPAVTAINYTSRQNAIAFTSYISTGSQTRSNGDIIKQEASRRYLVQNSDGIGQCKLITTSTLTAGTMNIIATDFNGSTYYVNKLTAHKARLVRKTSAGAGWILVNNVSTGWTLASATGTVVSIAHTV
jgi:hypothetical protein